MIVSDFFESNPSLSLPGPSVNVKDATLPLCTDIESETAIDLRFFEGFMRILVDWPDVPFPNA